MKLLIMGAPGGGKGTQAEILAKKLSIPTISTGAMLRNAIAEGTEFGVKAKYYIEAGNLVPDQVVIGIVIERLKADDCKNGYILDGFPRTIKQAEAMEAAGIEIDHALVLDVADEIIIMRVSGRRVCPKCGATFHVTNNAPKVENICDACNTELVIRNDDNPETVKNRMVTYHEQTKPVIDYYKDKGKLIVVNGSGSVEEINQRLLSSLGVTSND